MCNVHYLKLEALPMEGIVPCEVWLSALEQPWVLLLPTQLESPLVRAMRKKV